MRKDDQIRHHIDREHCRSGLLAKKIARVCDGVGTKDRRKAAALLGGTKRLPYMFSRHGTASNYRSRNMTKRCRCPNRSPVLDE